MTDMKEAAMTDMMNGVDRNALFGTIDAVKGDPGLAAFEFRVQNEWLSGGLNRSTVTDFYGTRREFAHEQGFVLMNDEHPILLSKDKGPNPVENLLHALAGCMTTTIAYHAAAKGKKIDAIRSRFEGDLDLQGFLNLSNNVRRGFSDIRIVFEIEGNLTLDEKREILALAPQFSPVFDVVTNGTRVTSRLAEDAKPVTAK